MGHLRLQDLRERREFRPVHDLWGRTGILSREESQHYLSSNRVAVILDPVALEAASQPHERHDETPQLRLEQRLPTGSPYRSNDLVCAGPAMRRDQRQEGRLPRVNI